MALIKCSECQKEVSSKANTCPHCGCPITITTNQDISIPIRTTSPETPKKKKMGCGCLVVIVTALIACVLFTFIVSIMSNGKTSNGGGSDASNNAGEDLDQTSISPLIDSTLYSNISAEQLIELMGEPQSVDESDYDAGGGEFHFTTYEYKGERDCYYGFIVANDKVVRLDIWTNWYNKGAEPIKVDDKDDVFQYLSIADKRNFEKIADTGVALRYRQISPDIQDVWAVGDGDKTFYNVKITYNISYFDSTVNADGSNKPELELIGDLAATNDGFTISVEGTVKNNSRRAYTYVQITFGIYDSSGNKVGTALDNISGLEPGGTWKFNAISLDAPKNGKYKLEDITGY